MLIRRLWNFLHQAWRLPAKHLQDLRGSSRRPVQFYLVVAGNFTVPHFVDLSCVDENTVLKFAVSVVNPVQCDFLGDERLACDHLHDADIMHQQCMSSKLH